MTHRPTHPFSQDIERRLRIRAPVRGFAIVKSRHGALVAEAVDISSSGVCVSLTRALDVGAMYRLDLEIHAESKRSTSVVGRVCFCLKGKGGYRVGFNCALADFLVGSMSQDH
jgi:hypothetical protein